MKTLNFKNINPEPILEFKTTGEVLFLGRQIESDDDFCKAVKLFASGALFSVMPQTCDLTATIHWLNVTGQDFAIQDNGNKSVYVNIYHDDKQGSFYLFDYEGKLISAETDRIS